MPQAQKSRPKPGTDPPPAAAAPGPPSRGLRLLGMALPALLSLGIAALFLRTELHELGRPGFPMDDPYIHLQFARNLATGHGLSYNPGEPTPGATSPLWVVLLAAGFVAHIPGEWLALALGALAGAAAAALAFDVGLAAGLSWPMALLAGLATAASGRFQWAGLSGMETCLAAAVSLLLIRMLQRGSVVPRRALLLGAVAGLCVGARPEMALLAFAGLALIALEPGLTSKKLPSAASYLAGFAALTLPYIIFCLATTGRPLPNTFYAKSLLPALDDATSLATLRRVYLPQMWTWMWRDNAAVSLLAPLGLVTWTLARGRRASGLVAWWPILFWGYALALYPRHFSASRYTIPLIPMQCLLAAGAADWAARRAKAPSTRAAVSAALALAFVPGGVRGVLGARDMYLIHVDNILDMQVKMSEWVRGHLPAGARVATNDVGAITYFGGRYCIDTEGLVAPRLISMELESRAENPRPGRDTILARYFSEVRPDYCILFPSWYPALVRQPWLERVYSIDRPNYTGGDSHFVVYRVVNPPWGAAR